MKYTGFPVHNSTLAGPGLAQRVLSKYNLPSPISCNFLRSGVNDTYIVKAGAATYFLRVYRYGWRTKGEIQAELEMLIYLHQRRLPVSWPIERKDGACLTPIAAPEGVRYAALFTNAPGKGFDRNIKNSCAYGELAGKIHSCLDKAPDDGRRFQLDLPHLIDQPLHHIEPFLEHRRKDFDYLKKVGGELKLQIGELLPKTKPEYGNCHGDHHGGNLHMDNNGKMTLFDFDCYGYGWRAYDLAVFLWNSSVSDDWSAKAKSGRTRGWNAFLEGYSKTRTLGAHELKATNIFVPIRHIWLLGLHTQLADTSGRGWFDDSYFDFHIRFIKRWLEYRKIL